VVLRIGRRGEVTPHAVNGYCDPDSNASRLPFAVTCVRLLSLLCSFVVIVAAGFPQANCTQVSDGDRTEAIKSRVLDQLFPTDIASLAGRLMPAWFFGFPILTASLC